MVEEGGGATFPVVFYDGERDTSIGNVCIHPSLDFKSFQFMICQKIGISSNQISIYLADRRKPKQAADDRRRIPITGKVNFSAIVRQKDCFFMVVLKRSRRDRMRKTKLSIGGFNDSLSDHGMSTPPTPEKIFLLRRDQPLLNNPHLFGLASPFYNQLPPSELTTLNERLKHLQVQRDNYAKVMAGNSDPHPNLDLNSFPKIGDCYRTSMAAKNNPVLCEGCMDAKRGKMVPFHHCVYDPVIAWSRTKSGPIARPSWSSF